MQKVTYKTPYIEEVFMRSMNESVRKYMLNYTKQEKRCNKMKITGLKVT